MKGEYVEQPQQHHLHPQLQTKHEPPNNTIMFPKLHPPPHPNPNPHHHPHLPFSSHFQLSRKSDDEDSPTAATPITHATAMTTTPTSGSKRHKSYEPAHSGGGTDGATIEVVRKPRGRPPGSKNKPKPPVIITRDAEPAMSPYILEVPGGSDVVEAISRFCRRRNMGICVLTGSGTVANVTLRQPSTTPGSTITFHGRFDILSISATFLPQPTVAPYPVPNNFTISLAGPQGQIVGGIVAGGLVAAGAVFIIAATFTNPCFYRLSGDEEVRNNSGSGGGIGEANSPGVSGAGGGESGHAHSGGESSGGGGGAVAMGGPGPTMYGCHVPSDLIWAPTPSRPPQAPPPF